MRGLGHFIDNPAPTEVKHRFKILLLGTNFKEIIRNTTAISVMIEKKKKNVSLQTFLTNAVFRGIQDAKHFIKILEEDNELRNSSLKDNENDIEQTDTPSLSNISDSIYQSDEPATDCSLEGLHFIAGYIAHNCLKFDKNSDLPVCKVEQSIATSCGWIRNVSRGDLIKVNEEW